MNEKRTIKITLQVHSILTVQAELEFDYVMIYIDMYCTTTPDQVIKHEYPLCVSTGGWRSGRPRDQVHPQDQESQQGGRGTAAARTPTHQEEAQAQEGAQTQQAPSEPGRTLRRRHRYVLLTPFYRYRFILKKGDWNSPICF